MNKIDQKRENEKRILKVMIDIYLKKTILKKVKMCEDSLLSKLVCVLINVLLWN